MNTFVMDPPSLKYKSNRVSLPLWGGTKVLSQYKSIEVEYKRIEVEYKSIEFKTKVIQANLDHIFLIPVSSYTSWGIKTG
jgi:hypothetical protein